MLIYYKFSDSNYRLRIFFEKKKNENIGNLTHVSNLELNLFDFVLYIQINYRTIHFA